MSEKERIPICNCLEWDSMINTIKMFSPKEKYRKFVRIIKILINVMPTRTSVLINEQTKEYKKLPIEVDNYFC